MIAKRVMSVFTVASHLGFPFPDPERGRPCADDGDVWLGRFTRRRGPGGPGIFLGCSRSDYPRWYVEFDDGIDQVTRARCLKILGGGLAVLAGGAARTPA